MEETIATPTELALIIATAGLDEAKSEVLTEKFSTYFALAAEWAEKAKALTVTTESQVAEMKMAREGRLFLRAKRLAIEQARKELKEQSLREGRAIDTVAAQLKALIDPTEDYLHEQEQFAVRAAAERLERLRVTRHEALAPYTADPSVYALADLSEEAFTELLNGLLAAKEARAEAARKAEAQRLADAEAERIRLEAEAVARQTQRLENERLRAEALETERVLAAERAAVAAERAAAELAAAEERRQAAAAAAAERQLLLEQAAQQQAAADAELRKERAAAEQLRQQAAAKQAAERQAREAAQAQLAAAEKARVAAEKKAKAAPDREKLLALSQVLNGVALPELATPEGQQILTSVRGLLDKVTTYIHSKAEEL